MPAATPDKSDLFAQYQILEDIGDFPTYSLYKVKSPNGSLKLWKKVDLQFNTAAANETRLLPVLEKLHHPYLNAVTNSFMFPDKGLLFVECEFPAKTLRQRLQECRSQGGSGGIPVNELYAYMAQVADGLDYLNSPQHPHQNRKISIYHRGICPDALHLFEEKGKIVCKLGDFGLAKPVLESAENVRHSLGLTNYDYAPPEFDEGLISSTSDQYSLATTYYFLRTGKLPFTGSLLSKLQSQLSGAADLSAVDAAERPAIARALSKEPSARFKTCREFVQQLQSALGGAVSVPLQPQRGMSSKGQAASATTGTGVFSANLAGSSGRMGATLFNKSGTRKTPNSPEGWSIGGGAAAPARGGEAKTIEKKEDNGISKSYTPSRGQEQQLSTLRIPTPKQGEGWKVETLGKTNESESAPASVEQWTPGKVTSAVQAPADPIPEATPIKAPESKAEMLSPKARETLELIKKRQAQASQSAHGEPERPGTSGTRFGKSSLASAQVISPPVSAAPQGKASLGSAVAEPPRGIAPAAGAMAARKANKKPESNGQAALQPVPELSHQPAPSTEAPRISWMTIVMVMVAAFCTGLLLIVYFTRQVPK